MYLLTLHCSSILHCYREYIMEKPAHKYTGWADKNMPLEVQS